MNDDLSPHDPWLTVAEIADELRVNPATVRLWITKDLLPAKRAGRRKLLVRRSDLDEMLLAQNRREADRAEQAAIEPRARASEREQDLGSGNRIRSEVLASQVDQDDPMVALRLLDSSDEAWRRAVDSSVNAPPDADFPYRVRALAIAAAGEARALERAAKTSRLVWTPSDDEQSAPISPELRPGANRPGPTALWAEYDRRVERIFVAMRGRDFSVIAARWQDLAEVMHEIADALLAEGSDVREEHR